MGTTVSTTIRSLIPCPSQASWIRTSAGITWNYVWKATEDTQQGPERTFVEVSGTEETFQGTRDALCLHFLPHWNKDFLWGDCGGWRYLQCRHTLCHSVGFLPFPLGEQIVPAGGHRIEAKEINRLVLFDILGSGILCSCACFILFGFIHLLIYFSDANHVAQEFTM